MISLFLSNNWKWLLGAVTSAALGIMLILSQAAHDVTKAGLRIEKAQTKILSEKIETQNAAVSRLERVAKQNREVYLAGLDAANRRAVRLEIKASDYLTMPVPSNPDEACRVAGEILEEVTR